jgi:polar amino acid transport system substrate-binding protein
MKRRHFIFTGCAAVLGVFLLQPQAAMADALSSIMARKTIRVAVPQDFPPFGSVGTDMAPRGYDIDMANLIASKLGVKAELVPVTSANRIPYLQTNKVDLVISSLGKNAEREKVIDFTTAYAPFFNGIFAPADFPATKVEDLAGKTVGVTAARSKIWNSQRSRRAAPRSSATRTITAPSPPSCPDRSR